MTTGEIVFLVVFAVLLIAAIVITKRGERKDRAHTGRRPQ